MLGRKLGKHPQCIEIQRIARANEHNGIIDIRCFAGIRNQRLVFEEMTNSDYIPQFDSSHEVTGFKRAGLVAKGNSSAKADILSLLLEGKKVTITGSGVGRKTLSAYISEFKKLGHTFESIRNEDGFLLGYKLSE